MGEGGVTQAAHVEEKQHVSSEPYKQVTQVTQVTQVIY
jgi:hypothetical protein